MTESEIQCRVMIACNGLANVRLFRNSCGYDREARQRYGLQPGSGDLIGWRTRPDGVAQFVSLEIKSATGRTSSEQDAWLRNCQRAGCCAAIVRSVDDALAVIEG